MNYKDYLESYTGWGNVVSISNIWFCKTYILQFIYFDNKTVYFGYEGSREFARDVSLWDWQFTGFITYLQDLAVTYDL